MPDHRNLRSITLIGGGKGAPELLVALNRCLPDVQFAVIVPVTDTGRSTGVVRELFDIPAVGDVRHALTTIAGSDAALGAVMDERLHTNGDPRLDGMAIGNLVLAGLIQRTGNLGEAAKAAGVLLGNTPTVLPVSIENVELGAVLDDGSQVVGELEVRRPGKSPIADVFIEGKGHLAWTGALEQLQASDVIILGPGSLWTSICAILTVTGIPEAIARSNAKTVYVANTTTQPGQTDDMTLLEHWNTVFTFLGRAPDFTIANCQRPNALAERDLSDDGLNLVLPMPTDAEYAKRYDTQLVIEDLLDLNRESPKLWNKLHTAYHDMDRLATTIVSTLANST